MHRLTPLTLAATLMLGGSVAAPAAAQTGPSVCDPPSDDDLCGGVSIPGDGGSTGGGGGGGGGGDEGSPGNSEGPPSYPWYDAELQGDAADPDACWGISVEYRPEAPPEQFEYATVLAWVVEQGTDADNWDICPSTATDLAGGVSQDFWNAASLPLPVGSIEPDNRMITGMTAYLTIDDQPQGAWPPPPVPTPLGALTLDVVSHGYDVDWGDGTSSSSSGPGVPYPGGEGEITHVYTDAGSYTVTVTSRWSATVTVAGASLDLGTRSISHAFPVAVDQVQPVRER